MKLYLFESLLQAQSEAELLSSAQRIAETLGYSMFCYGLAIQEPGRREPGFYALHNNPQAWVDRYQELGYLHKDGCAQHCLQNTTPLAWGHDYFGQNADFLRIHHESIEFGINGGLCLPIHTPWLNGAGMLMLSTSDDADKFRAHAASTVGTGFMLASYLAEATRKFVLPGSSAFRLSEELTPREMECLLWAAIGLSAKRIADKMGIAESTVATHHLPAIRRKLGAATTREAVAIAVYHQLVRP